MAGKKFKFRIDSDNNVGLKEEVTKFKSKFSNKQRITLCIDKDYNLVPMAIFEKNILTVIGEDIEAMKEHKVIYYPFNLITYIVTVVLDMDDNDDIINKDIVIHIPKGIVSTDEVYCQRVTSSFSGEQQEVILEKVLQYAKARI